MNVLIKLFADILTIIGSIGGSTLIALNIGYNSLGYFLFIVSGISSMYLMLQSTVSRSILAVNVFYIFINVVGFGRYL